MGRKLMRVPLEFKWPLNQVWVGYLNPFSSEKCTACDGDGLNPATIKLNEDWYASNNAHYVSISDNRRYNSNAWQHQLTEIEVKALVDAGRLMDFTRTPRNEEQRQIVKEKIANGGNSWLPEDNGYMPTPEEVNEWSKSGFGHDAINRMICVEARAKHLGVYGKCEYCKGEGVFWATPEIEKMNDDWVDIHPPTGEGFQLWTTTNEGAPITPVFSTLEALCNYAAKYCTTFGRSTATSTEWLNMLSEDFVCHKEGNMIFI